MATHTIFEHWTEVRQGLLQALAMCKQEYFWREKI